MLLWDRTALSVVWILPRCGKTGDVGSVNDYFSGNQGTPCLYISAGIRRDDDLVGDSNWMGACRCDRILVYEKRKS